MLPVLYQSHDFILYSYPLLMGLGWGIAYQIFFSLLDPSYPKIKAQILFWGIFLSGWIGAKLFFFLTYSNEILLRELSFWTGGGFVFYGGFIGGLIFIALFKVMDNKFKLNLLWAMLPALAIGHSIGRIGCFLAGCCYGKPTDFFWGVFLHGHYRHPTQLLEALGLLILGLYLFRSKESKGNLISHYLIGYGVIRLGIEALRGDIVRGMWGPLSPSQWISVVLLISGFCLRKTIKNNSLNITK